MEQMEEKIASVLGNPDMMQKIMSMAQALGAAEAPHPQTPPREEMTTGPDMASIQKLMTILRKTAIDPDQQNLLKALKPYLPRDRIAKLEKAMRAAKLATLTSTLQLSSGR